MNKAGKLWFISCIAMFVAITAMPSSAENNSQTFQALFDGGDNQTVSVYKLDSLVIERGEMIFRMGPGEAVVVSYGWDKPCGMIYKGSGKFIYAPPDSVEHHQLNKFKNISSINQEFQNATFFYTFPLVDLTGTKSHTRPINKDEWAILANINSDAMSHLGLYLPNLLLDDLMSAGPGKFFYADFNIDNIGHLVFIEDPTSDDWYRLYEIKRSAGALVAEVLGGFSPFPRPPSGRGVMPIDIYHYDIKSKIESDGGMEVTCRINYVPILQGRKYIYLNWYEDNKVIRVVDSGGKEIKPITKKESYGIFDVHRKEAGLGLPLNQPMTAGDSDYVEITYKCGTLAKKSTLFYIRNETDWYPRTVFRDPATYSLTYDCPDKYEVISSGEKVSEVVENGRRITKYEASSPIDVVGFNIGRFKNKVIDVENYTPIVVYLAEEIADASVSVARDFLEQSDTGFVNKPMDVYMAEKYQSEGTQYQQYSDGVSQDNRYYDDDYIKSSNVTNLPAGEGIPIVSGRTIAQGNPDNISALDTSGVFLSTTDRLSQAGSDVANSAAFFTSILGQSPFDTIKVTSLPENKDSRGAPGMIYLSWDTFIREDISGEEESFRAQQVAYQWFGHTVKTESYRDEWIINGLAKYLGLWFYEMASGKRGHFDQMLHNMRDIIFHGGGLERWEKVYGLETAAFGTGVKSEGSSAGSMVLADRLSSATFEDYVPVSYYKAAYIFHMIRYLLRDYKTGSDDRFAAFLKDIVTTYKNKNITTDGLQSLLEKHVGGDMSWFFNEWVYGTKIPTYEFSYIPSMTPDRKWAVKCQVTQKNVPGNFKMIVPVTILFEDDKYIHLRIWVTKPTEDIVLPSVPFQPKKVIFNTYDAVLCKVDNK